ncbi:MAG: carboxypeptidase regulatory-like domain-containing protein [Chitinispirillia bacterium]|nr:carboxypeptidase regulatory-like domain-containing protein [Chitinispirillia bacterium]
MTVRKGVHFVLLILLCCFGAATGQGNSFAVVEFPLVLNNPADVIDIGWISTAGGIPDDASIYFARTPGGGNLRNYNPDNPVRAISGRENTMRGANPGLGLPIRKGTSFRSGDQRGMGPGVYYCIVAAVKVNGSRRDTLVSNEFTIMIDAPSAPRPRGPSGRNLTDLTPTFSWDRVPNTDVPYFHVILSDEPLPINFDNIDNPQIEGDLSIVWQAITPRTSITYGEPDPSGTITASPPPLSPGKEYSWMVFSNFGNHPAFSSNKLSLPEPFLSFTIAGTPLNKPQNIFPVERRVNNRVVPDTLNSADNPIVEFQWTNLDTNANTYLVNLFVAAEPSDLGLDIDDQDGLKASILVWETTVSRGNRRQNDTLTARLDAANTLTGGAYKWRVFALDSRGAGTAGDASDFVYRVPQGSLDIGTKEVIGTDTVNIGVVELRSEVLSGPMEKPLAFYTSTTGFVTRLRPAGTYRITAVKEGYKTETRTVTVRDGERTSLTIFMERPRAAIFGRVTDANDIPLNLANVTAVSEWGDTVRTLTNGGGNFTLSCSDADWTVFVEMAGYRSSSPVKLALKSGQNEQFNVKLERNPIVLSGNVRNTDGEPVIGVRVRIFREGVLVNELPSTPQSGNFSFSLSAGTYTLTAEKSGFTTHSGEIALSGSRNQNITLRAGAGLVNGVVIGRSWSNEMNRYIEAPVPSARVKFWVTAGEGQKDTVTVVSDAVFGNFSIGLEGGKRYSYIANASGFIDGRIKNIPVPSNQTIQSNQTVNMWDTLYGLAMMSGRTVDESGRVTGGIDVVVFDRENNRVAASGRSSNDGSFEVRNIGNGSFSVNAARAGYYLVGGARNFRVEDGQPKPQEGADLFAPFVLKAGETTITWSVSGYRGNGIIKVASPYMGAYAFNEPLTNAGYGEYVIEAEAADTTLINLSYHKFIVAPGVSEHKVEFSLPFRHIRKDVLKASDKIEITGSASSLRARLFYRSEGSIEYRSVEGEKSGDSYSFTFPGARDGSNLYYYFNVHTQDGNIYGSEKQIFRSYVEPDPAVISHFEVIPGVSSGETLLLPSSYRAQFLFRAFYGSSFIALDSVSMSRLAGSIKWDLDRGNCSDCRLEGSGLGVTVRTGSNRAENVVLTATLDLPANSTPFKFTGTDKSYRIPLSVSGSALRRITVLRTDPKAPEAIANREEAAFRAVGVDSDSNAVTVSPVWTIEPRMAGRISRDGKFTPCTSFVGNVRVFAAAGGINAEFNPVDRANKVTEPGLAVGYMLRNVSYKDTVSNRRGLRIVFPQGSIGAGEVEHFEVSAPDLTNLMKRNSGSFTVVDSLAFDIVPRGGNSKLNFGRSGSSDSITVVFDIPSRFRDGDKKDNNFFIAWWNPRVLEWQITNKNGDRINSKVSSDGLTVSAAVTHFSEYALVDRPEKFSAALSVSPNPFSPFIRPVKEYGQNAALGTCIKVGVTTPGNRVASVKVHIFNAVGHRVWAVEKLNAEGKSHEFWWDGRTTKREQMWHENFNEQNRRSPMARNGRYFVTVIVKDVDGEVKRMMKPVVLMK